MEDRISKVQKCVLNNVYLLPLISIEFYSLL